MYQPAPRRILTHMESPRTSTGKPATSLNVYHLWWLIVSAVLVGLLLAATVLWGVSAVVSSNDRQACNDDNLTRIAAGQPIKTCE